MKYNILVTIYHSERGDMGEGYLLKDNTSYDLANHLDIIHNSGLRENGISVWYENQLVHYGNRIVGDSTINFEIVEFPEQ